MERCLSCMQKLNYKSQEICPHCGESVQFSCDITKFLHHGTVLQSKFLVGKPMGDGGFGNTYIGWNELLQCKVAIKEYYPKQLCNRRQDGFVVVSDEMSRQRFLQGLHGFLEEARSIASLQDVKGVVQVYSFFEANNTGYIVMEYLEGMDVSAILKECGNVADYEWSRRIILTVLHTLQEIHKRNVLHRDIAPDNVFVTNEGVIKLIDFGAAKHTAELAGRHGEIMLKVGYAPLEQYSNRLQQGPYTDLYAVAAMFYRLLTGQKPQPANERHVEDKVKSFSDMGISIPEQAEMGIMVCLNLEPQYRLQSAAEFMEALDGLDFTPVYEPRWMLPSLDVKNGKNAPWKKVVLAAGIILAIGIIGGAVYSVSRSSRSAMRSHVVAGTLPQLIDSNLTEAVAQLDYLDIKYNVTYRLDSNVNEEKIADMQPAAGTPLEEGQEVSLTVLSTERLSIPSYKGMEEKNVKQDLSSRLGSHYKESSMISYSYADTKKGKAISQTLEGEIATSDVAKLKVDISWGNKNSYKVKMPSLKGKTVQQAKTALKKAGMAGVTVVTKEKTYSSTVQKGKIISQTAKAGTIYNGNTADSAHYNIPDKVAVVISKGEKPVVRTTPKPVRKPPKATKQPTKKSAKKQKKNKNDASDQLLGGQLFIE